MTSAILWLVSTNRRQKRSAITGEIKDGERARACYDELETRSRHEFVAPSWLAVAASSAGLAEDAFRWAERGVTERDPLVIWSRLPYWDTIRAHPRFAEIMRGVFE